MAVEISSLKPVPVKLDLINSQGQVIQSFDFVKDRIVLGRVLSADARIDDPKVSRLHALIEVKGTVILLTDLASTHGTFLNGVKVLESQIKYGDVIKIGTTEIRISEGSGDGLGELSYIVDTKKLNQEGVASGKNPPIVSEGIHKKNQDLMEDLNRRDKGERRNKNTFPEERRLDDRRGGDRRSKNAHPTPDSGASSKNLGFERRVGDRRKADRRLFDITSLERRIEDRRHRRDSDALLPEELEKAFSPPNHSRELEVTALWGDHILDLSNYYEAQVLTVGESPRSHYIIPSEGIPDEFPLITLDDESVCYLALSKKMSGTVRIRDKMYSSMEDLGKEKFVSPYRGQQRDDSFFVVSLKQDDFAKIKIGNINFFLLYVKPAPVIKPAPIFDRDPLFLRTIISSLIFLFIFLISMNFVPEPKPMTIDMVPERYAKIVIKKRPKIPPSLVAKNESAVDGGSKMGEGGKPKDEEGEAGKKNQPKKEKAQALTPKPKTSEKKPKPEPPKQVQTPKPQPPKPQTPVRKIVDEKKAKSVGLLRAFQQSGLQKDLKNLVDSSKDVGKEGFDEFGKAVSGLKSQGLEESMGAGGKGLKGIDVGGGGKTIGIDGPSTKGLGRGFKGDGIGEGISGPGRLGMKGEHAVNIANENIQVLSGLPKDIINAVVQRHRAEIRSCYDAALQRNSKLKGKITVSFNISPQGDVTSCGVKDSTLSDAGLEGCIVSRIKTWKFPKPEAPVVTEVSSYPFFLSPSN